MLAFPLHCLHKSTTCVTYLAGIQQVINNPLLLERWRQFSALSFTYTVKYGARIYLVDDKGTAYTNNVPKPHIDIRTTYSYSKWTRDRYAKREKEHSTHPARSFWQCSHRCSLHEERLVQNSLDGLSKCSLLRRWVLHSPPPARCNDLAWIFVQCNKFDLPE